MANAPEKIYLAAPRGYCAGVDRAVQTVEHALELYGAPVYVRKEIVHNKHVVEELREKGAIFVDQETEVPEGETVVFSAHGVAPSVHENAAKRQLRTIDATCPLVTKVLVEVARYHGSESHLIDNETQVQEEWLEGKRVVGITSGASAPESLVQRLVQFFRDRGVTDISEFHVVQEDVRFMLPKHIRTALAGSS